MHCSVMCGIAAVVECERVPEVPEVPDWPFWRGSKRRPACDEQSAGGDGNGNDDGYG